MINSLYASIFFLVTKSIALQVLIGTKWTFSHDHGGVFQFTAPSRGSVAFLKDNWLKQEQKEADFPEADSILNAECFLAGK